jgi:hypothetical protein
MQNEHDQVGMLQKRAKSIGEMGVGGRPERANTRTCSVRSRLCASRSGCVRSLAPPRSKLEYVRSIEGRKMGPMTSCFPFSCHTHAQIQVKHFCYCNNPISGGRCTCRLRATDSLYTTTDGFITFYATSGGGGNHAERECATDIKKGKKEGRYQVRQKCEESSGDTMGIGRVGVCECAIIMSGLGAAGRAIQDMMHRNE